MTTLCPDCQRAARELWPVFGTGLCCKARAIAGTPRRLQRQAFDALTSGLSPLDAHAVRVRAHEIIRAQRGRGVEA